MKQYFVIHSKNPYLLARLCTELQMEGFKSDFPWNNNYHPFIKPFICKWLRVGDNLQFHAHPCEDDATHQTITEENYLSVLTKIIEQ